MTQRKNRVGELIREVESVTKRLRADVRKRADATGMPKALEDAAKELRKRAAALAAQVEKYVHDIRKELEKGTKAPARKTAARKTASRKGAARKTGGGARTRRGQSAGKAPAKSS